MAKLIPGTKDILPGEVEIWQKVEETVKNIFALYGYSEIRTPVMESTELFHRSIGEATDIVEKEMYSFDDKGGRAITLRPEGTAPVVRAYVENHFPQKDPFQKFYYMGPMFRYERPQKGRYRQFHQIGVEVFGSDNPFLDVEVIAIQNRIFKSLNIDNIKVKVNSLGCKECRPIYRETLIEYLRSNRESLCETCQNRLEKNPLRVLDCKNEDCQKIIKSGPTIRGHLCDNCNSHYSTVLSGLNKLNIDFVEDSFLVRGLDYYSKTVFEFVNTNLGAQNTVSAGGRYDGLVQELGGKPTPGIGFALGVERLTLLLKEQDFQIKPPMFFIPLGENALNAGLEIIEELRDNSLPVIWTGKLSSLKSQLRHANRRESEIVLILGENEVDKKVFLVKNMRENWEKEVLWKEVTGFLKDLYF